MKRIYTLIIFLFSVFICHAQTNPPIEFELLLIIKPTGSIPEAGFSYTMSEMDIAAATKSYLEYFPALVDKLSYGTVKVNTTVKVSTRPLTSISNINDSYSISPTDVQDDINEYSEIGQYDCIQTYYSLADKGDGYWGLSFGNFFKEVNHAGYSAIVYRESFSTPEYLDPDSYSHEIWLHEWLHSLEKFYIDILGVSNSPHPAHLDAAHNLGYTSDIFEDGLCVNNLAVFYSHYLMGKFTDFTQPTRPTVIGGFGPEAWKHGTPRKYFKERTTAE